MSDQRKGRSAVEMGPTSKAVATNVRRLRERRGLSTYDLSRMLRHERPISPSAISKLERGERQVTVDDLAALAVVFGVSPSALLLPLTETDTEGVEVTGGGTVAAVDAWEWANGKRPLRLDEGREPTQQMEHQLFGVPQWLRTTVQEPVHGKLTAEGSARVNAFREAYMKEHGRAPTRDEVLSWLMGANSHDSDADA